MPLEGPDSTPNVKELHQKLVRYFAARDAEIDAKLAALSAEVADIKRLVTPLPPQPDPPPPSSGPVPTGVSGNWALDWSDEFTGTSLDTSKWWTGYPWDHHSSGNGEVMVYSSNLTSKENLEVRDGKLLLKATYRPDSNKICDGGYCSNYASGMVNSRERMWPAAPPKYLVRPGSFVEVKAKVPRFNSMFPAIWLLGEQHEIDLMEVFGNVNEYSCGYHINKLTGHGDGGKVTEPGEHISDDADVFGAFWGADGAVSFYFNGSLVRAFPAGSVPPNDAMGIFLNLAIGFNWKSEPLPTATDLAGSPAMEVDYVRVWKRQ
jgi:beta-glucanase (GH16 family)